MIEGETRLAQLPPPGALRGQDEVLDELLGERAAALGELAAAEVDPDRPPHGPEVDTRVLVEPVVLRRQYRLDEMPRHWWRAGPGGGAGRRPRRVR